MVRYRFGRLAEEFKKEISDIIQNEIKDPRVGFVSIINVQVSGDLRHAKVFVSILGNDHDIDDTMAALKNATGFVRREVARRVQLRYTPEIVFVYDDSIVYGAKISKLLHEVISEGNDDE